MTGNKLVYAVLIAIIFFSMLAMPTVGTNAGEEYTFVTMWPELPQPWYFDNPTGIAVDGSGNVFVADSLNNRIQKFDANGNFITKWGSEGTGNGQLKSPEGIAVDSSGNVYVADTCNDRIQKFDSYGSFVTNWGCEGTGDGEFDWPLGIAVDSSGYVFVADSFNDRIQKFDANGNFITKWGSEGTGNGQFKYPQGIAVDSSGNVYVADTRNDRIQKFDANGNFITKWGSEGTGNGQFNHPNGIAVDSSGNVFVADTYNYQIQKFDANGNFITKWGSSGTGNGQFDYPIGIAVDSSGYVFVADTWNHRIQKFDANGNFITKWGSEGTGNGQLKSPEGIAVDSSGNVYVADTRNDRIQKFDANGNFITKWGSSGTGNGQFDYPHGIAVDSSGYIFIADTGNNRIQKFDANGNFITKWGSEGTGNGQFKDPEGTISIMTPKGITADSSGNPEGITADSSGNVYVADTWNHRIQKFDANGKFITKWGSKGTGNGQFYSPCGVAVDSNGYVYVTDVGGAVTVLNDRIQKFDSMGHRIQKFDANGNFITKWGSYGTGNGQFYSPRGIAVDSSGYVYVVDSGINRIQKFDAHGNFITKWGSEGTDNGQFKYPYGVAVDISGYVYVADSDNNRIQKFAICVPNQPPVNPTLTPDKRDPQYNGTAITWTAAATDPDGDTLYYQFWIRSPSTGNSWTIKRDWSSANTWTWHTCPADIGDTDIRVWIRDGHHEPTSGYDLEKVYYDYTIKPDTTSKPDLIIINIYRENKMIYYTITNQGSGNAEPSASYLFVDGCKKAEDYLGPLSAGEIRTEYFIDYDWQCSGDEDEIKVCADAKFEVDESDETNNCLKELFRSPYHDLVIIEIHEENGTIFYTIKNQGDEDADPSSSYLYIDGAKKAEDSVGPLPARATSAEQFDYEWHVWECSDAEDVIKVCADATHTVRESDETNNCKENYVICLKKPDLIVTDINLTVISGVCYVEYSIANVGTVDATSSTTYLYVDGKQVLNDFVGPLAPNETRNERFFDYAITGTHTIKVCADAPDEIKEIDEDNNCKVEELTCGNP
jgi:tripartite motif-containing protein 71